VLLGHNLSLNSVRWRALKSLSDVNAIKDAGAEAAGDGDLALAAHGVGVGCLATGLAHSSRIV
jgi:hypothetical protein